MIINGNRTRIRGVFMPHYDCYSGYNKSENIQRETKRKMFYWVIDLEMCKVPRDYRSKSYRYANATIQIGGVLLGDSFKRMMMQ